jgi:hypothetical protein
VNAISNNAVAMGSATGVQRCVGLSLSLSLVEVFSPCEGVAIVRCKVIGSGRDTQESNLDLIHTHLVTNRSLDEVAKCSRAVKCPMARLTKSATQNLTYASQTRIPR